MKILVLMAVCAFVCWVESKPQIDPRIRTMRGQLPGVPDLSALPLNQIGNPDIMMGAVQEMQNMGTGVIPDGLKLPNIPQLPN